MALAPNVPLAASRAVILDRDRRHRTCKFPLKCRKRLSHLLHVKEDAKGQERSTESLADKHAHRSWLRRRAHRLHVSLDS